MEVKSTEWRSEGRFQSFLLLSFTLYLFIHRQSHTKMDLMNQIREDIRRFKAENGCDRLVMVWAASTEIFMEEADCHRNLEDFEAALANAGLDAEWDRLGTQGSAPGDAS